MSAERQRDLLCARVGERARLMSDDDWERIGGTIQIAIERGERCRACGSTLGPVYWFKRDEKA